MATQSSEGDTLSQFQTPEQLALLDAIDDLSSKGLGHYGIDLPQLIVCGEQSSGKSSLLEGLTRLRFPMDSDVCTLFATELVLRRDTKLELSAEIHPSKQRSALECREMAKFKRSYTSLEGFSFKDLHNEAETLMARGVPREERRGDVFNDVLRVRYSGPDMPSFTIVDLPGFIDEQWKGGNSAEQIVELVSRYMQNQKSIILAVMSAKDDVDCQKIFKYLDLYDPKRERTLGILTKPDLTDKGSNMEKIYIDVAKNLEKPMKHHWHTVRNRAWTEKDTSSAKRDETEAQFFTQGPWANVPRKHVGIAALREKLSRVLLEHIGMELPSLVVSLHHAIEITESSLTALGQVRETTKEQRAYLTGHAERFQMLTNDALRGIYSNRFFALATLEDQSSTRLRTTIQNLNIAFSHTMYCKGQTWDITIDRAPPPTVASIPGTSCLAAQQYAARFEDPMRIGRTEFLEDHIGEYVRQSRPSGLPSLVNPWVIGEVFQQQSRNWSTIAKHHLQQVYQALKIYIEKALKSLVDSRTLNLLMLKQIQPELDRRWRSVQAKLEELLLPFTEQDPITYDPGFLRDLEEMRASRYHDKVESQAKPFIFGRTNTVSYSNQRLLTESLDGFTNSEILDLMQTYYKSAISVFVSNVAVLAIENCLIKDLSAVFSPTLTANMEDEQLYAIAAESEEGRRQRAAWLKELHILKSSKQVLCEHTAMTPITHAPAPTQTSNMRPRTPETRLAKDSTRAEKQAGVETLTPQFNSLVVTPPHSGANSRDPSRSRHDSATGTPSPLRERTGKKPSSYVQAFLAEPEDEEL
ncbi:dynamin-1 [Ampelomyces quisqualis]|uniref:Dynamin-1 n=1 Tax=Ampelomyces quisqualis TaxID=50730 RepID=A0A6A5QDJ6_AMPQU|nr:dynamin-1 [Ampelomyces quisqualis]